MTFLYHEDGDCFYKHVAVAPHMTKENTFEATLSTAKIHDRFTHGKKKSDT